MLPSFALSFAAGAGAIAKTFGRWKPAVLALVFVLFVSPPSFVLAAEAPPWLREEIEPVLKGIAAERQSDDQIYVYWGAAPATAFYGPRHGLTERDWKAGALTVDWHTLAADIDSVPKSRRLWIVFSHDKVPGLRDSVLTSLDSIGRRDREIARDSRNGASGFLYSFDVP